MPIDTAEDLSLIHIYKGLTKGLSADYNDFTKENETNLGGNEDDIRSNDRRYDENGNGIFANGELRGNTRINQRENTRQDGNGNNIYEGISKSDIRSDETGLSHGEQQNESSEDVNRPLQGEQIGGSFDGNSKKSDQLYEGGKTENDESMEDYRRESSRVHDNDFSTQGNSNQGSSRGLENIDNDTIKLSLIHISMEIAGSDALDKDTFVERKGLGTPATRAGIIENLIYKGFVERDKKNLIATHKGINLVTIVSDTFKSAKTTAEWEMKLSDIASGKASKDEFLKGIEKEIRDTIKQYSLSLIHI